jgi:hypothetical protein
MPKPRSIEEITRDQAANDLGSACSDLEEVLQNYRSVIMHGERKAINRAIDILNEISAELRMEE